MGIEDSKFLLESSLNQNSISVPQDSKNLESRAEDIATPDIIAQQRSQMEQ